MFTFKFLSFINFKSDEWSHWYFIVPVIQLNLAAQSNNDIETRLLDLLIALYLQIANGEKKVKSNLFHG